MFNETCEAIKQISIDHKSNSSCPLGLRWAQKRLWHLRSFFRLTASHGFQIMKWPPILLTVLGNWIEQTSHNHLFVTAWQFNFFRLTKFHIYVNFKVHYAVHLRTKINDNKWYLNFKNKMIDVEITIHEVEIAAFEHQLTNYLNPMTHSLKFKFKIGKKFWIIFWTSTYEIRIYYFHESQKLEWQFLTRTPESEVLHGTTAGRSNIRDLKRCVLARIHSDRADSNINTSGTGLSKK